MSAISCKLQKDMGYLCIFSKKNPTPKVEIKQIRLEMVLTYAMVKEGFFILCIPVQDEKCL